MRIMVLALAALILGACGSTNAKLRDCGQWVPKDTNVQANSATPCNLAQNVGRKIWAQAARDNANGASKPYSGAVQVDGHTLTCTFHRTGHTVYACTGGRLSVRLSAQRRD